MAEMHKIRREISIERKNKEVIKSEDVSPPSAKLLQLHTKCFMQSGGGSSTDFYDLHTRRDGKVSFAITALHLAVHITNDY